jgi:exopolysaccharide biosynthesis protein
VGNNFPAHLGEVQQAMASGPHLISDRQIDISFQAEDFGEKDSSVMSFSLTRAVEVFEAARSFMALKGNKIIIGTVSGTALGTGLDTESAGMTFGELAQLCDDLQVDQAYALDGGGSSSIVVPVEGKIKVLNIPTGGSDVKRGEERFINTHWLFFPREG